MAPKSWILFYIRTSVAAKTMLHCVKCLDFDADADTILSQSINFAHCAMHTVQSMHGQTAMFCTFFSTHGSNQTHDWS